MTLDVGAQLYSAGASEGYSGERQDRHDTEAFQVRLEVFEGPLDLLLKLIEKRQLEISRVSLATVTGEFLAYVDAHPGMLPGPLASFVWIASKLLWIKSQALLPRPPAARSDDNEEEDPGDELVRRLAAYKRVQEAARWLRERDTRGLRSYERPVALTIEEIRQLPQEQGAGLDGVTLVKLTRLVQRRMQMGLPIGRGAGTTVRGHTVTVAEKLAHLRVRLNKLKEGERIPMANEFVEAAAHSRTDLVVLFLAVLEVVRRNYAAAEQDELFGEIWLSRFTAFRISNYEL